jgi:hypothetical protein
MFQFQSRRRIWLLAMAGAAVLACLAPTAAHSDDATATMPPAKLRIGVYDSRAVTVAYAASDLHNQWLRSLIAQRDQAKAAGETQKVKALEDQGAAHQVKFHNQGFGTAPVDDILA